MPEMDGLEAARVLRSERYPNLIVGLTGQALDGDVREFLSAGADLVLPKPYEADTIRSLLDYARTVGCSSSGTDFKLQITETGIIRYKV